MEKETQEKPKPKLRGAAAMGAGPGRPKGVPNKNTTAIKDMIRQALDEAGGVEYLVKCADDPRSRAAFLGLVGKVLPMTVTGDPDNPLNMSLKVEFVNASTTP